MLSVCYTGVADLSPLKGFQCLSWYVRARVRAYSVGFRRLSYRESTNPIKGLGFEGCSTGNQ